MKNIFNTLMMVLFVMSITACTTNPTTELHFDSKLADGKKVELVYEVSFEQKSSCVKLQKDYKKIRYALSMIFLQVHSKELVKNGERKVRNSLLIILKKHFSKKVIDVQVTGFKILTG